MSEWNTPSGEKKDLSQQRKCPKTGFASMGLHPIPRACGPRKRAPLRLAKEGVCPNPAKTNEVMETDGRNLPFVGTIHVYVETFCLFCYYVITEALRQKEIDMTKWTMAQAKRDFEIGYLSGFRFWRSIADGQPWTVGLEGGTAKGHLVDARTKTVREFKTLDAAVRAAEEVGFEVKALVVG